MTLRYFTPAPSSPAGLRHFSGGSPVSWRLPPTKGTYLPGPAIDPDNTAILTVSDMTGGIGTMGSLPLPRGPAQIDVTFSVSDRWQQTHGYDGGNSGMEDLLYDFFDWVVDGGLGHLKAILPAGSGAGKTGARYPDDSTIEPPARPTKVCTAWVTGKPTPNRAVSEFGAPIFELPVTFVVPSGYWTMPNGLLLPIH